MKISAVRDVLTDEFVGIVDETFLPGGIGMGEVDFGMQHFCDIFVLCELGSVVCGDGKDVPLERAEHLHHKFCHSLCIPAFGGLCHELFLGGALD